MVNKENPYFPYPAIITDVINETPDGEIKSFAVQLKQKDKFDFIPGQFAEISLWGKGEVPIGIASSPTEDKLLFTVKRMGLVTSALHNLGAGEEIGLRAPLGNGFPMELLRRKNIIIIGGGFAFTTLRALTIYLLANRKDYEELTIIYGAKTPAEIIYKQDFNKWAKKEDIKVYLTVDKRNSNWSGKEGLVPKVVGELAPSSKNAVALICGPPIMIKFTIPVLKELGFTEKDIFTSLEMRMKCGIGKCGRCNIGHKYVCKDGPIFSIADLLKLPQEF